MAFVSVPKDLTKVKNKILFNLTKRQLLCLSCAAAVGFPVYLSLKGALGTSTASVLMIMVMLPFFFIALYAKDGIPFEQIAINFIRVRYLSSRIRPYETENLYTRLQQASDTKEVPKRAKKSKSKHQIHQKSKPHRKSPAPGLIRPREEKPCPPKAQ